MSAQVLGNYDQLSSALSNTVAWVEVGASKFLSIILMYTYILCMED
jgi:hypothetical protein